ncbi:hypothetical protein M8818_000798 [Zalaria obscura]|uniref:Uncharacterized protein n=1 Tax=Zalaria obscura TaxID=2024903 RepID=A0ACC3SME9_9PEZI
MSKGSVADGTLASKGVLVSHLVVGSLRGVRSALPQSLDCIQLIVQLLPIWLRCLQTIQLRIQNLGRASTLYNLDHRSIQTEAQGLKSLRARVYRNDCVCTSCGKADWIACEHFHAKARTFIRK